MFFSCFFVLVVSKGNFGGAKDKTSTLGKVFPKRSRKGFGPCSNLPPTSLAFVFWVERSSLDLFSCLVTFAVDFFVNLGLITETKGSLDV